MTRDPQCLNAQELEGLVRQLQNELARVQLQLEDATDDVASLSVERSDLADEVKTLRYEIAELTEKNKVAMAQKADSKRYRHLRDEETSTWIELELTSRDPEDWDAFIDKRRALQEKAK